MSDTRKTYDKWLGVVNTQRQPPILEVGGKAWWTRGHKTGREAVIALVPDYWEGSFDITTERIPSGTTVESVYGERFIVP